MTDNVWINILIIAYFLGLGLLGFYLLWDEWQWMRKEDTDHEMRTIQNDTTEE